MQKSTMCNPGQTLAPASTFTQEHEPADHPLLYEVAGTREQVIEAWHLVYTRYYQSGLIPANPARIHTNAKAQGDHACVVLARHEGTVVSTLTAMLDTPRGLPLDDVYADELASLRARGCRLIEVGLFADRRKDLARTTDALLHLMRYAFHFGRLERATDFIVGVHPHHARFYERFFGFTQLGEQRSYATVNNNPVVLLHVPLQLAIDLRRRAVDFALRFPLGVDAFASRHRFDSGLKLTHDGTCRDCCSPAPAVSAEHQGSD